MRERKNVSLWNSTIAAAIAVPMYFDYASFLLVLDTTNFYSLKMFDSITWNGFNHGRVASVKKKSFENQFSVRLMLVLVVAILGAVIERPHENEQRRTKKKEEKKIYYEWAKTHFKFWRYFIGVSVRCAMCVDTSFILFLHQFFGAFLFHVLWTAAV